MMGFGPIMAEEGKEGSFLWLAPFAPAKGWTGVPRGGMCLCAFLFVVSGEKILLGKYADHPAWENLSGMDSERVKANARGWTIPASHLKFGEDPRGAARRIGEEILTLDTGLVYSEPSVKTFFYEPTIAPGERHFDVLFLFEVSIAAGAGVRRPPWYEVLEWFDIGVVRLQPFARQHEDVAEAWLKTRAIPPKSSEGISP
jgi:ADP-ribose pyrophosphatase YjhB (NUDIX family)